MPKNIILNESQISLLLEAMSLDDIYGKYYSKIDRDVFNAIIESDPTFNQQHPDKMGKYGKWLLKLYIKGILKEEDLYKANEYLTKFIKFYNRIEDKDINHYNTLTDLYNAVKVFDENDSVSHNDEIRKIKEGAEKVYEDDTWLVVVPHTKEASIYYGNHTQWCTSAKSSYNMFDDYNEKGPLFININKKTNKKYQFHFESEQFMDETDSLIPSPIADKIGMTHGQLNYYKQYAIKNDLMESYYGMKYNILFNDYYDFENFKETNGFIIVYNYENNRANLVNKYDEFFFKKWVDKITSIPTNYFLLDINDSFNFIDKQNFELLFSQFVKLENLYPTRIEPILYAPDYFNITLDRLDVKVIKNRNFKRPYKFVHAIIDSNGNIDENTLGAREFSLSNGTECIMHKDDKYYIYNFKKKEFSYKTAFDKFDEIPFISSNGMIEFKSDNYTLFTNRYLVKVFDGIDCDMENFRKTNFVIFHSNKGYTLYEPIKEKFLFDNFMKEIEPIYMWKERGEIAYDRPIVQIVFMVTKQDNSMMLINKDGKIILDDIADFDSNTSHYKGHTLPYNLHITKSDGSEIDVNVDDLFSTYER